MINNRNSIKIELSQKQKTTFEKYICDRLYMPKMRVIIAIIVGIVGLILLMSFIGFTSGKGKVLKTDEYNYASGDEYEFPIELITGGILLLVISGFNLFMYLNKVIEKTNILTMLKNGSYVVSEEKIVAKEEKGTTYPYYVHTNIGGVCECPVFIEYRNFAIGDRALCIYICNSRFAMQFSNYN